MSVVEVRAAVTQAHHEEWASRPSSGHPAGHRPDRRPGRAPDPGTIADAVLGPLYRRVLWGTFPADAAYAASLVDRLLSPACRDGAST